jgi:hypothetical protein
MNTAMQGFDSRSMPLAEPSTAPCALSWWRWFGRRGGKASTAAEVRASCDQAAEPEALNARPADDPGVVACPPQASSRR